MRKLFIVIVIFNAKFILDLGMVRIPRDFPILGGLWDVFIISILKYVLILSPSGGDLCHGGASKLICETNL